MKYAIIEAGGKQFKAVEGTTIDVDLLPLEAGADHTLSSVLLVVDGETVTVGTPNVKGAKVLTTVVGEESGPKLVIFNYRPKKHYRVKTGHRQHYTRLMIQKIEME